MLCILKQDCDGVSGRILAHDLHDARRQAISGGEQEIAEELYRIEFTPPPGRHQLIGGKPRFYCEMLVS